MKRLSIILVIIISTLILGCNNLNNDHSEDIKKITPLEERKFGIYQNDGNYMLDTSVILSNQNLTPLILELEKEKLTTRNSYEEAPKVIRDLLDSLSNKFDIANPGEGWQVGCVRMGKMIEKKINNSITEVIFDDSKLPSRELIYLGTSKNITLMTYYTGGIGKAAHTLIVKHRNDEIIDLWKGRAPFDGKNKSKIIEFFLKNSNKEWGLNTNIIYF